MTTPILIMSPSQVGHPRHFSSFVQWPPLTFKTIKTIKTISNYQVRNLTSSHKNLPSLSTSIRSLKTWKRRINQSQTWAICPNFMRNSPHQTQISLSILKRKVSKSLTNKTTLSIREPSVIAISLTVALNTSDRLSLKKIDGKFKAKFLKYHGNKMRWASN